MSVVLSALFALTCSSCGSSAPSPPPTYSVGGTVAGLGNGSTLTLANDGGHALSIAGNGAFTFTDPLLSGSTYSVTVSSQPTNELCSVSNGSGTIADASISNVTVACILNYPDTVIHSFGASGTDGFAPTAGLVLASDGNFYGTTSEGGASGTADCGGKFGCGSVYEVTPSGAYAVVYSFGLTSTDGVTPQGALLQASDGYLYGTTAAGGTSAIAGGTVFKLAPGGGGYSILYSFGASSTDGTVPYSALIEGTDGNLYGTTMNGGANSSLCNGIGCGTVFKITLAGVETVLYSFGSSSQDGEYPQAGLVQGSDGNFYGTTYLGGAYNEGTVFKITPSGTYTLLYSFGATATDALRPLGSLVEGADGNFYGTTYLGGASICGSPPIGCGAVFMVTPGGKESVIYSFGSTATDGYRPVAALTLRSDGSFYGTTASGGTNGAGTVFELTPSGIETVLYSFSGPPDGASPTSALVAGSGNNFYGTTEAGGTNGCNFAPGCGTVFSISLGP